jgi:high-affinity K+ transport system ATPase subunit B
MRPEMTTRLWGGGEKPGGDRSFVTRATKVLSGHIVVQISDPPSGP